MTIKARVERLQRQSPGALGSLLRPPRVLHPRPDNHSRSPQPRCQPSMTSVAFKGEESLPTSVTRHRWQKKRALQFFSCNLNFWWICRMEVPFKMRVRSQNAWDKEFVENFKVKVETWGCTYGKPVSEWRNKDRTASQREGKSRESGFKTLFHIVSRT